MSVYVSEQVAAVTQLHAALLKEYPADFTVAEVIERQAATLVKAHGDGDKAVCVQLGNWLPQCVGKRPEEIMSMSITAREARTAVSREHGFRKWKDVRVHGRKRFDAAFERAVDATVTGELEELRQMLGFAPELAERRSVYGHGATLLHYLAANGVETWRQRVPSNAVALGKLLIRMGADPGARASIFGGEYRAIDLLASSAHPAAAGVVGELAAVIRGDAVS